jgi:hypothetical protein
LIFGYWSHGYLPVREPEVGKKLRQVKRLGHDLYTSTAHAVIQVTAGSLCVSWIVGAQSMDQPQMQSTEAK